MGPESILRKGRRHVGPEHRKDTKIKASYVADHRYDTKRKASYGDEDRYDTKRQASYRDENRYDTIVRHHMGTMIYTIKKEGIIWGRRSI